MHERRQTSALTPWRSVTLGTLAGVTLAAGASAAAKNGPAATAAADSTSIEFASTPVVVFNRQQFAVVFRTKQRLPERSRRDVRAVVNLDEFGSQFPVGRFSRTRPCYDQQFDGAIDNPKEGKLVRVSVRLKGSPESRITARVRLRRTSSKNVFRPSAKATALIGCAGERP